MIIDLECCGKDQSFSADICIIGGGPAGITIAKELIGSGITACLVESGGQTDDRKALSLYDGYSIGHPVDLMFGRYRILGGSSTRWGGRCAVLDASDFESRPWVLNSGWPITYEELSLYYNRAGLTCNFRSPWDSINNIEHILNVSSLEFENSNLMPYVWRYATPDIDRSLIAKLALGYKSALNFGRAYRLPLDAANNIKVILHSNFVSFRATSCGSRAESVRVSTLQGISAQIRAKKFILCCGGIENARILLNSPNQMLKCINKHDNIGRYFHQHPVGRIGIVEASRSQALALQKTFNMFLRPKNPVQYEVGLCLSPASQRDFHLLNASASLYYEMDNSIIWKAGRNVRDAIEKRHIHPKTLIDLLTLGVGFPALSGNIIRRFVFQREVIKSNSSIRAVINLEQQPMRESRIFLSNEADKLGMKKVYVDWKISKKERETARQFAEFLDYSLCANRLGKLKKSAWLTQASPMTDSDLQGNLHFMGATRMAADSQSGVVDTDCRVFGSENLYVSGLSVFPTGGHANPMLTLVALAIRLADHLKLNSGSRCCRQQSELGL